MIWVEILTRQGEVLGRHRVQRGAAEEVCVGRGYDNDVVLDDPFVAAHHLRIARDESGALVAHDLDSANGLFVGHDRRRQERVVLDPTRPIRIGRTFLRVRQTDFAVAAEQIALPRARTWPLLLGFAGTLLGAEFLAMWLNETTERSAGDYLGPLLSSALFVAAWTAAWAILSRIFSGRARFERHLAIALGGLLVIMVLNELGAVGAFAFSVRALVGYRYVAVWLVAAAVCFLHLRLITRSREVSGFRLRLISSAVLVLAALGIGMQTLSQSEAGAKQDRQSYIRGLKPPMLRLVPSQEATAFFEEVAASKARLDRARSETVGNAGITADDDED